MAESAGSAVSTAKKQRGRPFRKGVSGNPAGRKPGSKNYSTILLRAIAADDMTAIAKALVARARGGDTTAAKIILDRLAPLRAFERLPECSTPDRRTPEQIAHDRARSEEMSKLLDGVLPCF
jgi:hypothetical protein